MATRGTALLGLGLIGALLGTTGCIGADHPEPRSLESSATSAAALPEGRDEFLEALRRTQGASHRYTVRGSLPEGESVQASGAFASKGRLFEAKIKTTGGKYPSDTHRIVVGKDDYLRNAVDKYWVHLDRSRVKKDSLVYFDMSDPTGPTEFASLIGSMRRTAPGKYEGHFNPESGPDPFLPLGAPGVVSLGIRIADFTATTDAKGWVTSITVELEPSEGPTLSMTTTFSGHGTKLPIKAPPKAQVREADGMYYAK